MEAVTITVRTVLPAVFHTGVATDSTPVSPRVFSPAEAAVERGGTEVTAIHPRPETADRDFRTHGRTVQCNTTVVEAAVPFKGAREERRRQRVQTAALAGVAAAATVDIRWKASSWGHPRPGCQERRTRVVEAVPPPWTAAQASRREQVGRECW